jgi:hypothetical protein
MVDVLVKEPPVKAIPDLAPISLLIIAHPLNVARGADIGFGSDLATIGILTHAVNVGHHDPIISVNEHLHKSSVDLIGINLAKQHEIPKNHQPFYMV